MKHYDELNQIQRQQVDATVYLLNQDFYPLDNDKEAHLKERLANLVLACQFHDETTREALTKVLNVAGEVHFEAELIDFVAASAIGRDVLEKRTQQ